MTHLVDIALVLLLGSMVFFPAVVAPTVFKALDEKSAGLFLRALFPKYYWFIIAGSAIGLIGAAFMNLAIAAIFAAVIVSTLWVLLWLMPRVNKARDAELAGDEQAGKTFAFGHRLSVLINMAQMLALIAVAVLR